MNNKVEELVERRAEALRKAYMPSNVPPWRDTPYRNYWIALAKAVLNDDELYLQITGETSILTMNLGKGDESYCAVDYIPLAEELKGE